jgi:hypothetical protein
MQQEQSRMKAEERKENETNALRRWLLRQREKFQGRTLYVLAGSVVLLLAVIAIVFYWRASVRDANSRRIREYRDATTDKNLEEIITSELHRGKPTASWAKLDKARLALWRDGLERIGTQIPDMRKEAFAKLEEGKKLYQELINDFKDNPSIQQEVWVACAKAEEALLREPRDDSPNESRGDFNKVIEFYRKAAAILPDSDVSKGYNALADAKKAKQDEIEAFYRRLYQLGFLPKGDPFKFDPSTFDPSTFDPSKFKFPKTP